MVAATTVADIIKFPGYCSSVENVLLVGEQWHLTLGRISVLHRLFLVTRRNIIGLTALGAVMHYEYLNARNEDANAER